jgi:uncharacterized delta-60 repeat protein
VRALSTGVAALALTCLAAPSAFAGVADPDPSFGEEGVATVPFEAQAWAKSMAIAPDGDIVVVGSVEAAPDTYDLAMARLNPDGSLDEDFGDGGRLTLDLAKGGSDGWGAVAIRPDGHIVVAGSAQTPNTQAAVVQLDSDGALDPSFGDAGLVVFGFGAAELGSANDVALDDAGNVVVAGWGSSERSEGGTDAAIARLTPDGQLDPSFDGNGMATIGVFDVGSGGPSSDRASGLVIEPDGDIVVGGSSFWIPRGASLIVETDSGGTVKQLVTGGEGVHTDATLLASGEPLIVGYARSHGAPYGSATARLVGSDAIQGWGFEPPWTDDPLAASASAVAPLPDGRAIVAGRIEAYSGSVEHDLFLFDPSSEEGFVAQGAVDFVPSDVAASSDGKVLAADAHGSDVFAVRRFMPPTADPVVLPAAGLPPKTQIVSVEAAHRKATIRFRSHPKDATFECKLDAHRWQACDSPYKVGRLDEGKHRFKVRAVSPEGTRDKTPAKRRFSID